MERTKVSAVLMLVAASAMWGFSGVFSREIMAFGFTPYQVTSVRLILTSVLLLAVLLVFDRGALRIDKRDIPFFLFFGALNLVTNVTLFVAQEHASLSLSTTLQMMSPVWVLIIMFLMYHTRITANKAASIILSIVGAVMVTGVLFESGSASTLGIAMGLISGFSYGIYTLGAKSSLVRGYSPVGTVFWMFTVAALFSLIFADPIPVFQQSVSEPLLLAAVIGIAVVITILPYWLQARSMKVLDATSANVIGVLEAVAAAMVGFGIYGEVLTIPNIVGMLMIFAAVIVIEMNPKPKEE